MKDQQYVYVETASRPKQEDCARSPLDFVIHQKEDAKKNYPGDAAQDGGARRASDPGPERPGYSRGEPGPRVSNNSLDGEQALLDLLISMLVISVPQEQRKVMNLAKRVPIGHAGPAGYSQSISGKEPENKGVNP
ncbi:hypothetical protein MMC16_003253 [Acarospora aff. strigata]|nr:hypothetical protein [Acarospora aff. strigata]